MIYTINHTTYGTKTIEGRYNTAATWALWNEEAQVVGETGSLIHPDLLVRWLTEPRDGSRPSN
jgi:hypothetical protein